MVPLAPYREGNDRVRRSRYVTYPFGAAQGGTRDGTDEDMLAESLRRPEVFGERAPTIQMMPV
jgi:hypothetical protein